MHSNLMCALFALGTGIEPEEYCYPRGGMTRLARAINVATGRLNTVRCGIPDTYFSIPAVGGYLTVSNGGILIYHPKGHKRITSSFNDGDFSPRS